jgi:cytochrome b6-f complex iron-sulfur subunit
MAGVSRRGFLQITARGLFFLGGLIGLGALVRFLSYQPDPPPPTKFEIGPESNYSLNSRTVLPQIPALLIRTHEGFTALDLVCTHLSCTVEAKAGALVCPCHGSRYDLEGNVNHGPAVNPLPVLRVERTKEGNLIVYRG